MSDVRDGDLVAYQHPDWGRVQGIVLEDPRADGTVLCLDTSPHGARERWPAGELQVLARNPPRRAEAEEEPGRVIVLRGAFTLDQCIWCDGTGDDPDGRICDSCEGSGWARAPIPVGQLLAALGGGR